ncbi:zinc-binding alcohol dehydrogenase family protein [Convivina intestini]|uniref:zinc-binding alcohol dehydrogenase family protein n=1 Tax=Convivina intestini TaxID=1505726 RepID=UPI00200D996D|nr:zinc-binding alcohol dehydrogenase family protein [Convivina intestini]CAH1852929.1 Zinc-type alcohol dehydrogenase-like protein [Convivina intestini]
MSILTPFKNLMQRFQPKMMAVGINHNAELSEKDAFISRQIPKPKPAEGELLVKISASSVNPIDIKTRVNYHLDGIFKVLGLDAVGEVENLGKNVDDFVVGDQVFYTGTQPQIGTNAQYQVIKAALVAHAPRELSASQAAAMPLTSITAYDILHQAFGLTVERDSVQDKTLLIINGAGGVGSILIQLAKYIGLTVIATAGNKESRAWEEGLGADHVLDYHEDLAGQLSKLGYPKVDYIANLQDTDAYWDLMVNTIKPFGRIAGIVTNTKPVDIGALKEIGAQFTWVFILARGNFNHNLQEQGDILTKIATLLDEGELKSTATKFYQGLSVESLKQATKIVEGHHTLGKVVIDYQEDEQ